MMNLDTSGRITGAELQSLREICGLTRDELAHMAGVEPRTIKFWEAAKNGVPADVTDMVATNASLTRHIMREVLDREATILIRFKSQADFNRANPDVRIPYQCWNSAMTLVLAVLEDPRIVWFDLDSYTAWLAEQDSDLDDSLTAWAAVALHLQAKPFRGDQPPKTV